MRAKGAGGRSCYHFLVCYFLSYRNFVNYIMYRIYHKQRFRFMFQEIINTIVYDRHFTNCLSSNSNEVTIVGECLSIVQSKMHTFILYKIFYEFAFIRIYYSFFFNQRLEIAVFFIRSFNLNKRNKNIQSNII